MAHGGASGRDSGVGGRRLTSVRISATNIAIIPRVVAFQMNHAGETVRDDMEELLSILYDDGALAAGGYFW